MCGFYADMLVFTVQHKWIKLYLFSYHQKYRLQGHTWLADAIGLTPSLLHSSYLAAKLNGYLVGVGGIEQFEEEVDKLGLTEKIADYVRNELIKNKGGNLYCWWIFLNLILNVIIILL